MFIYGKAVKDGEKLETENIPQNNDEKISKLLANSIDVFYNVKAKKDTVKQTLSWD